MPLPHPLPRADAELCRALAADMSSAGYTTEGLRRLWGTAADGAIGRGHALPARRLLEADPSDASAMARLFGIGDAIAVPRGDAAFPRTGVAGLETLGLAIRDGELLRPLALVRPQAWAESAAHDDAGEWWIASDLDEAALGGPLPEDHVLGVGGASFTLAGLQLTSPVARALDLGTGCGIQALRACRHATEVVATDVSERALAFARLNAAINGVDRIETRHGDMFEPVRGERFDRIVSNPPFVITPRSADVPEYEYRDAGRVADGIVAEFVTGAGMHLEPGGTAQLLGNWESRDGASGLDRVKKWVEASPVPLDAWVVEREDLDPIAYAELWIRDGGTVPGMPRFDELLGAWLDDFASRKVESIGFGYILLRRPLAGAPSLARYERLPQPVPEGGIGAHLTEALQAHDRLEMLDDPGLAASTLVFSPDVTEARHHLPGSEDPSVIELRQGGGFARVLDVDPALAALVGACDGDLAVGALVAAIAQLMEVDPHALSDDLLPRVRELVFTGFLRFAD